MRVIAAGVLALFAAGVVYCAGLLAWDFVKELLGCFREPKDVEPLIQRLAREGKMLAKIPDVDWTTPERERERHAHKLPAVREALAPHAATLKLRCRQLVRRDPYGVVDRRGWDAEVAHVIRNILLPIVPEAESARYDRHRAAITQVLREEVDAIADYDRVASGDLSGGFDSVPSDPLAYEAYCADRLSSAGWTTRLTPRPGDQGADIVAERAGVRLVVQCKHVGSPVGNGAVQEALAARTFYAATRAAVVSSAVYTPSAKALAAQAGVLLLHHEVLPTL